MSSAYEGLPVYKAATDMTVYFETVVKGFSRYHKYTIGAELRNLSHAILVLIAQANIKADREGKIRIIREKLQELKIRVQVCAEIKAFRKKNNFPTATRKVIDVSRQCEGWLMSCQNPERLKPLQESAKMKSLGAHVTGNAGIRTQGMVPQGSIPEGQQWH